MSSANSWLDSLQGFPVVVEFLVAWGEMDAYRHVNNVVYFRYFENARLEYFRRIDWFGFEAATGIGPILASTEARFRRPLTYPDRVAVGARIASCGTDRLFMEYAVCSQKLGDIAATGKATIVTFHYPSGQKVSVPEELRHRIEALEASVGRSLPQASVPA
ncbi:MAG: acyl-CoA thioesterase [Gemmataceae bacterium]